MTWRILIPLMSPILALFSGCASFTPVKTQNDLPAALLATCERLQVKLTKHVFTVNIADQTAALYTDGKFIKTFSCSTSKFGIGELKNSRCTPRGLHRIAEKIGDGEPAGTIFKSREIVGTVAELGVKAGRITTRIMWLDGLEPGFNQGGDVDTHERFVYIHGTGDQTSVGRPDSHGCIHLMDEDLIAMFDLLPSGTLVWISEK